jgi:hypothetical protein
MPTDRRPIVEQGLGVRPPVARPRAVTIGTIPPDLTEALLVSDGCVVATARR